MNIRHNIPKLIATTFILLFCLTSFAQAGDSKLVGHWKGTKISLNLKANHTYTYKMKALSFSGTWSASATSLTLNYSLLGFKKKRTSTYSLSGKNLVLNSKKGKVVLKK